MKKRFICLFNGFKIRIKLFIHLIVFIHSVGHIHVVLVCFYTVSRDVAAAQVIRNRGVSGLGHSLEVKETVCGLDATGTNGNASLVGTGRSRKLKKCFLGIPVPFRAGRMSTCARVEVINHCFFVNLNCLKIGNRYSP